MRPKVVILAVLVTAIPVPLSAQAQFEGKVVGTMAAEGIEVELVQYMKGSKMRVDMSLPDEGGNVSQITDVRTGQTLMILHEQKMWVDMAVMGQFMPGGSREAAAVESDEMPTIEVTEDVETIAGRECRHYLLSFEASDEVVDVCATAGLGCFVPGAPAGLNRGKSESIPQLPRDANRWIEEFGDGFFVLSMKAGDASFRVRELEEGSSEDEWFAPPAGYTQMQVPVP